MRAGMDIGIYEQRHDWPNMGPSLLIGAFLVLAVRTVKWPPRARGGTTSDRELDVEIENAIISWATYLAVLTLALRKDDGTIDLICLYCCPGRVVRGGISMHINESSIWSARERASSPNTT
jgi:hypothetical protein